MICGDIANKGFLHLNVSKVNSSNYAPNFKGVCAQNVLAKAANITSWQQRLALGVAGMVIQPAIDMRNKSVDPETRKISANRSLAKAFVGMATGIIVRGGCMKAVEVGLKNDKMVEKLAKLTAENSTKEAMAKSKDFIKNGGGARQYASVIGTIAALGIMMFTNFLVDAPVTNWLTNKLNKKHTENNENDPINPVDLTPQTTFYKTDQNNNIANVQGVSIASAQNAFENVPLQNIGGGK